MYSTVTCHRFHNLTQVTHVTNVGSLVTWGVAHLERRQICLPAKAHVYSDAFLYHRGLVHTIHVDEVEFINAHLYQTPPIIFRDISGRTQIFILRLACIRSPLGFSNHNNENISVSHRVFALSLIPQLY